MRSMLSVPFFAGSGSCWRAASPRSLFSHGPPLPYKEHEPGVRSWTDSIFGRDPSALVSWVDPLGPQDSPWLGRRDFADRVLVRAAISLCMSSSGGSVAGGLAHPQARQRALVYAAVLGCVDQTGRRILLANMWTSARLPWQFFEGGDWLRIRDDFLHDLICLIPLLIWK